MRLKNKLSIVLPLLIFSSSCILPTSDTNKKVDPSSSPANVDISQYKSKLEAPVFDSKKLDGIKVNLKSENINIFGNILDSKTNAVLNKKVNIVIEGKDKDKVEKASYSFDSGKINFQLKKGITVSNSNPVSFTIVANSEGYFSSSFPMDMTAETDSFSINLVNIDAPPLGVVSKASQTEATSLGSISKPLGVMLDEPNAGTQLMIDLPQGTTLKDEKGTPLTGKIQANIGYFNNQNETALNSFPGGLNNALVNINGEQKNGYFLTGGFASIELTDEKGMKAATFDKDMQITMEIPKGTMNPETGSEMKVGDKIGIWSYDTNKGKWASEGEGNINSIDDKGNFVVKYNVKHLSYWNLDWFSGSKCNPKLRLLWENGKPVPVNITAKFSGQLWEHPSVLSDDLNDLANVPNDRNITFIASFSGKEIGRTEVNLGPTCSDIQLKVATASLPELREIPVYVAVKSQTEFTKADINNLMVRFSLSDEQKKIVRDYLAKPTVVEPIVLTESLMTELENQGAKNIREVKALLEQKIRPDSWLNDMIIDVHSFKILEVKGGKSSIRGIDGERHNLSTYFSHNDKFYSIYKDVVITKDTKEIILEKIDTDLTITIAQEYLKKLGLKNF